MELEVLISTMQRQDFNIVKEMNISSSAIIVNQCNEFKKEEICYRGNKITMYSFDERGIGLSRNNALMRARGDICIFADDDVIYVDGYKKIILDTFEQNPDADIIMFNVESLNQDRPTCKINKNHRVRLINSLKYGAVNIAFRRESVIKANISFSLLFGGGAKYSAGEDSLFICECLKKSLKIYASTNKIADVKQEDSTWFKGYNNKYFIDKGVFFRALSRRWSKLLILQLAIRKYPIYRHSIGIIDILKLMYRGEKSFYER